MVESSPPDAGAAPAVVEFEHSVFRKLEGGHFRLSETGREPVFAFKHGELQATLPLDGIRREFGIAGESADGRMLDLVQESLTFVRLLRLGDPLPAEVCTGEASWDVQPHHREIAFQRITLQLVSWVSGNETVETDPEAIKRLADDPETKRKVNEAFGQAAQSLGLGRERREDVIGYIHQLVEEFAFIEALREKFRSVQMMQQKIQALRRMFGQERSVLEIADPVARLIEVAVKTFQDIFGDIDANTSEIIGVLRNLQTQTTYIRTTRDNLYRRLVVWDEMFAVWHPVRMERSEANANLLRKTYRFLAPRFMQVDEWVLRTQIGANKGANKRFKTEMSWF
mgnify:CR=1 FL=1